MKKKNTDYRYLKMILSCITHWKQCNTMVELANIESNKEIALEQEKTKQKKIELDMLVQKGQEEENGKPEKDAKDEKPNIMEKAKSIYNMISKLGKNKVVQMVVVTTLFTLILGLNTNTLIKTAQTADIGSGMLGFSFNSGDPVVFQRCITLSGKEVLIEHETNKNEICEEELFFLEPKLGSIILNKHIVVSNNQILSKVV